MRRPFLLLLLLTSWLATPFLQAKTEHLLPRPQHMEIVKGEAFLLSRPVRLADPTHCVYLQTFLENSGAVLADTARATVQVQLVDSIASAFHHKVAGMADESYRLSVTRDSILIEAETPVGVIRAAQTLQQLAEGYDDGVPRIEALLITDYPAFAVRGFMHDTGRSFIPLTELKKQIDRLARFKVNMFHWHLTENLAWRFQVLAYPALTADSSMTRQPGCFYTQAECRELERYAALRGMTVIPEIDMPGHSAAFRRALGFDMQSDEGIAALRRIIGEAAAAFPLAPYLHIGGDEVEIHRADFLREMSACVRSHGKRVLMWNRLMAGPPPTELCDMTQLWATSGRAVEGLPNIDCRYNYTNHFDTYADLVGIYKSNIYYTARGTREVAGTISAAWNDTFTPTADDILRQNNVYANVLASCSRAWTGGGRQYIEQGGTVLPNAGEEYDDFADFERRLLFHKAHSLRDVPMSYVRQSDVHWRISDPFPNGGDTARVFPPELCEADPLPSSFVFGDSTYATHEATGAGIYLRHIWHPVVPSFFADPQAGQTAYAWTYVFSPRRQVAGAQIEFYTYSRSGDDVAPPRGRWDRRGSRVWLNGREIEAPEWTQPDAQIRQDQPSEGLANENLTARPVTPVVLEQGWNKVFLRLPYANSGGTAREKWQFTFVLTTPDGRDALDGIVYSTTMELP